MRITARSVLRSATIVTVAVLLATAWALTQEPLPLASYRLPDGSVLRLEAITRGPTHEFKEGPYWQRLLARLPVPSLQKFAGDPIQKIEGSPDSLVFWASRSGSSPFPEDLYAEVTNGRDCSYRTYAFNTAVPWSHWCEGVMADVVPRRGPNIGLRFFRFTGAGHRIPVADLMTRNPWPGPYPVWQPERLPATKRDGDLAVTLTSLVTRVTGPGKPKGTRAAGEPIWTEAHLHCTWKGRLATDWETVKVTLRDPTGNQLDPEGTSADPDEHGPVTHFLPDFYAFEPCFCSHEPVWKLRLELANAGTASIDPADLWAVHALPLPPPGVFHPLAAEFSRFGATVRLSGIAGPGASTPGGGHDPSNGVTVHLHCTPPLQEQQLLFVRAIDDRGRSITDPGWSVAEGREYAFTLQPARETRSATLVFALVRDRFVEFVVHPSRA
jgi:hypothetical protein